MEGKELAKYGAVFSAGVLTVFAGIGVNSLIQPNSKANVSSANQFESEQLDANSGDLQNQDLSSSAAESKGLEVRQSKESAENNPTKSNSESNTKEVASTQLGAGKAVAGITNIEDLVRNTIVTIEGTVTRVNEEDEFLIQDATGSVQVYTGRTFFTVEQGQRVSVRGLVDDATFLEIYADEITLPDGTVVNIRHW